MTAKTPSRLVLCLTVAAALTLAAPTASALGAGDVRCTPATAPQAVVLVFHGGGFTNGSPAEARATCEQLATGGMLALSVTYPLRNVAAAERSVARRVRVARRRGLPVLAFGESAGGALAAHLAARGLVDGAVSAAGPMDFVRWRWDWRTVGLDPIGRRRLSPVRQLLPSHSPMLLIHSRGDRIVPFVQSTLMARRSRRFTLREIVGGHLADERFRAYGTDWIQRCVASLGMASRALPCPRPARARPPVAEPQAG